MYAFIKQFNNQINNQRKLKLTARIFLLAALLAVASSIFAQQNSFTAENRLNTANDFVKARAAENERSAAFSYVAIKGSDDANVQFYMTTALALAAGFDEDTATGIGLYNQYIDDNPKTSPVKPFNFKARRDYHFTSEKRRAQMWQAFVRQPNAANLGAFIHAKQDSYFHAGYNYLVGHIYAGVHPDQSWRPENHTKARNAARATFDVMLKAAPSLGADGVPLAYSDIEPHIIEFLHAADDSTRGSKFALLVQHIANLRAGQTADSQPALRQIFRNIKSYSKNPKNWQDNSSRLAVRDEK